MTSRDFTIPGCQPRPEARPASLLAIVSTAILLGLVVALAIALMRQGTLLVFWQQDASAVTYPFAFLTLTAINLASAWWSRLLFRGLLLAECLAIFAFWGLAPTLVVAALLLVYALAGEFAMRAIGVRSGGTIVLPLVLGLIGFGWTMQGLAFLPVHSVASYSVAIALVLLIGRKTLVCWARATFQNFQILTGTNDQTKRMAMGVAASATVFFAYVTHIPEVGTDALMTHLAVMSQIVRDGRFVPDIETLTWAYIPKPMHFAYLPALLLGGEYGVRCIHAALGVIAALVVGEGIYQAGGRRAGWLVAAFLLGSPLVMHESASIFVETYLSLAGVVGTLALISAWKEGLPLRGTVLAGLIFGGAAAAKLHGFVFGPPLGAILLAGILVHRFKPATILSVSGAVLAYTIMALPSFALPWAATGNPLFPYFNDFFRSPFFSTEPYHFSQPQPPLNIWTWVDMAVNASPYLEGAGPISMFHVYFLVPLVAVGTFFWRRAEFVIPAILGLGHIAIVSTAQNYLRYQTAGFFVVSIAGGIAMAWIWRDRLARPALCAMVVVVVLANAIYAVSGCYQYRGMSIWGLATRAGQEQLETSRAPERAMLRVAVSLLVPGERAAIFWYPFIGLSKDEVLPLHPFFGYHGWEKFASSIASRDLAGFFNRYHLTHVVIRHGVHFTGSDELMSWLNDHTDVVAENDGAALYKLREVERFPHQIVGSEDVTAWDRAGSPVVTADGQLQISGNNLATRFFKSNAGEMYLLRVRANCHRGDYFWLHINWFDGAGSYMWPTIVSRRCEHERVHDYEATFLPPPGAAHGAVILDAPQDTKASIAAAVLWAQN